MNSYCFNCMNPIEAGTTVCPRCGQATSVETPVHQLRAGTLLYNRYLIGKALGQGGFGITYIGFDTTLELRVAIKEYYPNGFSNRNNEVTNNVTLTANYADLYQRGKTRFMQEARILARFYEEPGIVSVRDFFEGNNTAYIVMEYLGGATLKNFIGAKGKIPMDKLLPMFHPMILSLEKIHSQGIIHRDISPDNIMVLQNGTLKLLDFGAAREVDEEKSISVMLKPGYAPEEQYRRKGRQGPWTDVYALCATIYFCLTGVRPEEAVERVLNDDIKRPSEFGVQISQAQESVIIRGLSVHAADRYQSVQALEQALYVKEQDVAQEYRSPKTTASRSELDKKSRQEAEDELQKESMTPDPEKIDQPKKSRVRHSPNEAWYTSQKTTKEKLPQKEKGVLQRRFTRIAAGMLRLIKIAAIAAALCLLFLLVLFPFSLTLIDTIPWLLNAEKELQSVVNVYQHAQMYANGNGLKQDYVAAMEWYQKAADLGLPEAKFAIGEMYYEGKGVKQDYVSAMDWYQKAAEAGSAQAMYSIGRLYNEGRGVAQDTSAAMMWIRNAEEDGNELLKYVMLSLDILHLVHAILSFSAWGLSAMLLILVGMIVIRKKKTKLPI